MSITYQCEQCSRWETVRDNKVGTTARCRDCGHEMIVPNTPDLFDDLIDGPSGGAPRRPPSRPSPAPIRFERPPAGSMPAAAPESSGKKSWLWVVGAIAFVAFKVAMQGQFGAGRGPRFRAPNAPRPQQVARVDVGDPDAPIALPTSFPDLGPAREVEPGVSLREVKLRPDPADGKAKPGHATTLWLYQPASALPAPRSLPCVLIAPAGGDGLSGMALAEGDRPEHIPYVRAGFAVLAFDIDGPDPNPNPHPIPLAPAPHTLAFLRARGGLVNARVAIEWLRARVPEVDPSRLYVAGHSSAGTFALLLAEHEPTLKGCLAYAPVTDLMARFGARGAWVVNRLGLSDLLTRYSPRNGESQIQCPVFLFAARDDQNVPFEQSAACADRLKDLGKRVTLDLVDTGGHYDSMLNEGIPRGIAWLKARDAEVRAGH